MVEVNLLHFHDKGTFLHRANPVSKIVALLIISTALIHATLLETILLSIEILVVASAVRLPVKRYRKELRFFFLMGTVIAVARLTHDAHVTETFHAVLRFGIIVCMGMLFAYCSAPDDIARSVGSLLDRIPKVPGNRIGATLELTVSSIPLLFDAALQISQARKSRGERQWRHPVRSIVSYGSAVFSLLLERAEYLEAALRARLYQPDAKRVSFGYSKIDMVLVSTTLLSVMVIRLIR